MAESYTFYPARRWGGLFHLGLIGLLAGAGGYGLYRASIAVSGLAFLGFLIPTLVAGGVLPVLVYRLLSLWRASYTLERDGIRLRWGLRREEIPADQVEWVRLDTRIQLPLPHLGLAWPGAVVGQRHLADGRVVEYLADRHTNLVVIATSKRLYAISPADSRDFMHTHQRLTEWGSLEPITQRSVYPTFLISRFQTDQPARLLLLASGLVSLLLLVVVAWAVPDTPQVALRFNAEGQPGAFAPGVRLFLLPVLNTFFWLADVLLGLFFYRRPELQSIAYLVWGASLVTAGLFLTAVVLILSFT